MVALFLGAVFLFAFALVFLRGGFREWRGPRVQPALEIRASGLAGVQLALGVTVLFGALLDLGEALSGNGAQHNAGRWLMLVAGLCLLPSAFIFVSLFVFGRPRFLIPPHLRSRGGAAFRRGARPGASRPHHHGR